MMRAMRKISAPSSARAGLRPPTATTSATKRSRFSSMFAAARSARADAGVDGGRSSRLPVATFGLRRVRNELAVMIMRNVRITEPRVRWLRVMGRSVVRGAGERHGAYGRSPAPWHVAGGQADMRRALWAAQFAEAPGAEFGGAECGARRRCNDGSHIGAACSIVWARRCRGRGAAEDVMN